MVCDITTQGKYFNARFREKHGANSSMSEFFHMWNLALSDCEGNQKHCFLVDGSKQHYLNNHHGWFLIFKNRFLAPQLPPFNVSRRDSIKFLQKSFNCSKMHPYDGCFEKLFSAETDFSTVKLGRIRGMGCTDVFLLLTTVATKYLL